MIAAHHLPVLTKLAVIIETSMRQAGKPVIAVQHRLTSLYQHAERAFKDSAYQSQGTIIVRTAIADRPEKVIRAIDDETGLFVQLVGADGHDLMLLVGQALAMEFPAPNGTTVKLWGETSG